MSAAEMNLDTFRELLSRTIAEIIRSWPDLPRRIFTQVHYRGGSVDDVARLHGLSVCEARQILEGCERRLRSALRPFRESQQSTALDYSLPCAIHHQGP